MSVSYITSQLTLHMLHGLQFIHSTPLLMDFNPFLTNYFKYIIFFFVLVAAAPLRKWILQHYKKRGKSIIKIHKYFPTSLKRK